jgi:hypothetical protein
MQLRLMHGAVTLFVEVSFGSMYSDVHLAARSSQQVMLCHFATRSPLIT